MSDIEVQIINKGKQELPQYQTQGSAGMDLRADLDAPISISPLERILVPTGLYIAIPRGYEGQVRARSGTSLKKGLTLINAVGTIDSDYRGELRIPIVNLSGEVQTIESGERIAQIVFAQVAKARLTPVHNLEETDRGIGGFGSTQAH
jgi:dUTP pyrophosphatase